MKKNRLVSRLIQMCVVLIGISFLTFLLTYLAPGDPATAMYDSLGITPSPEMLEQARQSMGLDKPFLQQYVDWIGGIFHGDFGTSFSKSAPVLDLLMKRLPATFPSGLPDWPDLIICLRFEAGTGKGGEQLRRNGTDAAAGHHAGHCHGLQIFQTGAYGGTGGAAPGLRDRRESPGNESMGNTVPPGSS